VTVAGGEPEPRVSTLGSGLRVVSETVPAVHSAALGFYIGNGSRAEAPAEAGLSHFLEHLLFKGSTAYGSEEIDQIFDAMGADLNAGTGKESTSVFARVRGEDLAKALDVLADMVWRPAFREVDAEREVVLEEIAMYEDDPQELVHDVLGEAVFGEHPLGRAILGSAEVIAGTPVAGIAAFHARRYGPGNVVVAAAGAVDHDELVNLVEAGAPGAAAPPPHAVPAPSRPSPATRFLVKDTEQYHVCLGAPGLHRHDERRYALRVLDNIWGGTSSSRLFGEIREKRGLAYAVYSWSSLFADTGQVGLYVGTRPENLGAALEVVGGELARLVEDPATEDELARSKGNVRGRLVLRMESTSARMDRLGSALLGDLPLLTVEEMTERVEAVTVEDLRDLAAELFAPERLSAAGIGPDEERFRRALEAVRPALAAPAAPAPLT
jgi:predicted Zn-dependent peptidase